MDIETFRAYCLAKKGTEEDFPFDDVTLCFRVMRKIFAITGLDSEEFRVNLKCDPEYAIELRETYENIIPGYHMNKAQWNTVYFERDIDDALLRKLTDHSYDLIVSKLPKKDKLMLDQL